MVYGPCSNNDHLRWLHTVQGENTKNGDVVRDQLRKVLCRGTGAING